MERTALPTSALLPEPWVLFASPSSLSLRVVDVLKRLVGRMLHGFHVLVTKGSRVVLTTSSRIQVQEAREDTETRACRFCASRERLLRPTDVLERAAAVFEGMLALAASREIIDAECSRVCGRFERPSVTLAAAV